MNKSWGGGRVQQVERKDGPETGENECLTTFNCELG